MGPLLLFPLGRSSLLGFLRVKFITLLILICPSVSRYSHIDLLTSEACQQSDKPLLLEHGAAAVLSLDVEPDESSYSFFKCDLVVHASPNYGLMVQVEEGKLGQLREGDGSRCAGEYLQIGRGDNLPFFTLDKTKKLCGKSLANFSRFEANNGQLLVWLRKSGKSIGSLSLVVTSYLEKDIIPASDLINYRACEDSKRLIRKDYFCDGRVNCAFDSEPKDESKAICVNNGVEDISYDQPILPGPPLNLISITLVLVCGVIMATSLFLLVARLRRTRRCCWQSPDLDEDCELPDSSVGPRQSQRVVDSQVQQQPSLTTALVTRGTTPEAEPPPAYHDLFPAGYQFSPQKKEVEEHVAEQEMEQVQEQVVEELDIVVHEEETVGEKETSSSS